VIIKDVNKYINQNTLKYSIKIELHYFLKQQIK